MTLVELLVVIMILVILIAVAIPVMRPQLKDRKLREASRQLNTFISVAKGKAAETGRPWGIVLVNNGNNAAHQIFLAESPQPFSGDTYGATATLEQGSASAGYANSTQVADSYGLIKQWDLIQFNFRGPKYQITSVTGTSTKTLVFRPVPMSGEPLPRLPSTVPGQSRAQFQVYRQPVRTSGQPLLLPVGTVVDFHYSGIGYDGNQMTGQTEIKIMFTPNGALDFGFVAAGTPRGTIHMLVGKADQTSVLQTDVTKQNINDPTASWVSIGDQTGTVTTAENAVPASGQTIRIARTIAQTKQTMGGR